MSSINIILTIGATCTAFAAIGYVVNKFFKFIQTATRFMDDWYGTEDFPGVVERLSEGNLRFDKIEEEIATVKAELFTNGGSSVRDAINRIEAAVTKNI
jgi:hypothetical protein